MDFDKLNRIRALIEHKRRLIQELERMGKKKFIDTVSGSSPLFPYVKHTIKVEGEEPENYYAAEIASARKEVETLTAQYAELEQKLLKYIDTLEDERSKEIFRCRYLYGMSEERIGEVVGYTQSNVSRILSKPKHS